jgi:hypothetical protein
MEVGTIPEYPNLGNRMASIIGMNLGQLSYTFILNDLQSLFNNDPTIKDLMITNVETIDDSIRIEFKYNTVTGIEKAYTFSPNDFASNNSGLNSLLNNKV